MPQTETVHHLAYVNGDLPGFLNHLEKSFIDRNEGAFIATVNPEIAMRPQKTRIILKQFHLLTLSCRTESASS